MAADNDDAHNLTPALILEMAEVAREFILKASSGNVARTSPTKLLELTNEISEFLAWPTHRVSLEGWLTEPSV